MRSASLSLSLARAVTPLYETMAIAAKIPIITMTISNSANAVWKRLEQEGKASVSPDGGYVMNQEDDQLNKF